jgi:hypothetical protein
MTKAELLEELEAISAALRNRELSDASIQRLTQSVRELKREIANPRVYDPARLRELKGLGKDLWRSIDVDEYIRQERASWD